MTERRKKTCRELERVRLREAIQVSLTRFLGITDSRKGEGRDRVPYDKRVRFRIRNLNLSGKNTRAEEE